MIGKAVSLIQIPNQRLFGPKAAAQYLGIHTQTLRLMTDEGEISACWFRNRKVYLLEELERVVDSLPRYNPCHGEDSHQAKGGN